MLCKHYIYIEAAIDSHRSRMSRLGLHSSAQAQCKNQDTGVPQKVRGLKQGMQLSFCHSESRNQKT